jgi:hypothetical protein
MAGKDGNNHSPEVALHQKSTVPILIGFYEIAKFF